MHHAAVACSSSPSCSTQKRAICRPGVARPSFSTSLYSTRSTATLRAASGRATATPHHCSKAVITAAAPRIA